jgi:hypothetical protein
MSAYTIQARVEAGAQLLDREIPGWEKHIDLEVIDISYDTKCMLGQLHGTFDRGFQIHFGRQFTYSRRNTQAAFEHGFMTNLPMNEELTAAWQDLIRMRLQRPAYARPLLRVLEPA